MSAIHPGITSCPRISEIKTGTRHFQSLGFENLWKNLGLGSEFGIEIRDFGFDCDKFSLSPLLGIGPLESRLRFWIFDLIGIAIEIWIGMGFWILECIFWLWDAVR